MANGIRLYLDEDVPVAIAAGLRRRGVDVVTAKEAGMLGSSDEVQLDFAFRQGRVIFTHDRHFILLHESGMPHCGVIYARQNISIGDAVRKLHLREQVLEPQEIKGRIEFL